MSKIIEVKTVEVQGGTSSSSIGRNNAERMKTFFAAAENKVLYPVGRILAQRVNSRDNTGETLGDLVANGDGVKISEVRTLAGVVLPLANPLVISLETVNLWCCPACESAHGTRKGVSNSGKTEPDGEQLAQNKWYYSPVSRRVFVISDTCWKQYVRDCKPSRLAHFQLPPVKTAQPSKQFKPSAAQPNPPNPPAVNLSQDKAPDNPVLKPGTILPATS